MVKKTGKIRVLSIVWQPVEEKYDPEFKEIVPNMKMTPCCILFVEEGLGKYKLIRSDRYWFIYI